jgi:hypothetical protein
MKSITNERSAFLNFLSLLASVTVIAVYCFNVFPLSLDIPYRDDFQDILLFVIDFRMADGFFDALSTILHQHADHLTLSSRIVYYLVFLAEGEVNFRTMTYVAHVGLLLLTWIYYQQVVDKSQLNPLIFLCLSLLLFNPRDYGIAIWPMAAFGFFFVYCYALASLHFLNRPNIYTFLAAAICAFLATFTMAIGQLIWGLGLIYLMSQRNYLQTKLKVYVIIWIIFTAFTLTTFHFLYTPTFSGSQMLIAAIDSPLFGIQAFLALLGSAVGFENVLFSQALGSLSLILAALFIRQGLRSDLLPLHYFLIFCIAAIAIIVLARVYVYLVLQSEVGALAFEPRYSFASTTMWVTIFILFVNNLKPLDLKRVSALITFCVVFNLCVYLQFLPSLETHYRSRVAYFNRIGLTYSKEWPTAPTLKRAASAGIYTPPKRPMIPENP